jgi:transposase, IS30 family
MTKKYYQLTPEQRYQIQSLIKVGLSQTLIAEQIGCHKSTISRELARNVPQRGQGAKVYNADKAQSKTILRHKIKNKYTVFSTSMKMDIKKKMSEEKYSPELMVAYWKKEGKIWVSHETIYRFIWNCKHTNKRENIQFKNLHQFLKHGKRRRKRGNYKDSRGNIPHRVSIEKRPKIVEKRKRMGDIEVDLIMGANHKSALLVTVDRATLYTTITKMEGKNANDISKAIIKRLLKFKGHIQTLTFDNDQAFAKHELIGKALNAKTFFTRPYTSQDKGTIENRNGVIRLFFPKKTDFNLISHKEVKSVERKINKRPIRKFNYLSANEMIIKLAG